MKKLAILLAVVLMANVASAAVIDITVNGQPWTGGDVKRSDIIGVAWNNTESMVFGGFGASMIHVTNGDLVGDEWVDPSLMLGSIAIIPLDVGYDVSVTGGGMPLPGGQIAGWTFHVPDYKEPSDYIIIDPYGGTFQDSVPGLVGPDDGLPYVVLHVIPEPMTIALLGLGGLLLCRRRK